jgi:hypothetical protein
MTTGDRDDESAIWRTDDRFATINPVVAGSQQARVIGLIFTDNGVYYGSDTELAPNHLYRLDRRTGEVRCLAAVEGSVFHAAKVGSRLLFSTAVEPSKVNRSQTAVLYESGDGENWREVARHRKDLWDAKYFQYGQLVLPSGNNETGRYWYSTFGVHPDNRIFAEPQAAP